MSIYNLSTTYEVKQAFGHGFSNANIEPQYPPDLELEPIHLLIDLHLDVANQSAQGAVTTTVRARRNDPTVLKLNAIDFEEVAVRDVDDHELTWRYDGEIITIEWAEPFRVDEEREVEVAYRVVQPIDGMYFSKPDEAYPNKSWYVTTDHETERARYWLPSIDYPNVRTTLDFQLRADSRFTILANGFLVSEEDNGDGSKTAHWKLRQRCPSYLICLAIGDFVRADDGSFYDGEKEIELAYFCSPAHSAQDLLRTFGKTQPMMAWMTKKLAMPFPYPKYYQYALPDIGGAMENISLVSWSERFVLDEHLALEFGWLIDRINVHEMAHSYFGDAIVCRDYAHAWLKESWATYIEQCWREDEGSQDEALYVYYTHASQYFNEADNRYKRPIMTRHFHSSWQMYDRHLYEGGACRLHTLRAELGDKVFWEAVQDYVRRYDGKVVETDHFRHVMEEHSGRSLGKFFDQWFHSPGYPDLKVTFNYDNKHKLGTFEIEQTQVNADEGIPLFILKSDISWTIDGTSHRLPVTLEQAKHIITVAMSSKPEEVRFDPDYKVLHKLDFNPGDGILRKQLVEGKDVIARILAASELAKTGKRLNIQAIIDAYPNEEFWGGRREFLKALGDAKSEVAIAGLVKIFEHEQEPMVMRQLFDVAGQYRDPRINQAISVELKRDFPYHLAKMAAYQALGAQREKAPFDLLAAAIQEESYNGFAQTGAFVGLAATRRAEAIELLLERVPYGATSNDSRPVAVTALAKIGKGQEKAIRERIIEQLTDLLRDPWSRVQWAAARGLQTMKAPQAIGAIEAFGRTLSHQDQVTLQKVIKSLRQEDKTEGSALKKQVEDLQEKVRKMEDLLQKLEAKLESKDSEKLEAKQESKD
jgi:aminopeptidase N